MARPLRIQFEGAWYHVMNRGINRANLFFNDDHKNEFLNLICKTKKIYSIEVHAYCLMSNHYHLIIHTPRGNISEAMKYLNSNFARYVNLTIGRDGPLFRGRFKAILISADDYLIRLSRYIHLNPMDANMIRSLERYKWSSYPSYLGLCEPPKWLSINEIVNQFGQQNFRESYQKFVELNTDKELEDFYSHDKFQPVLGDDKFREIINNFVHSHSISTEIVGADQILTPPSIESILNIVSLHFNVRPEQISKCSKAIKNPARRIAIYICREFGGYHLREIGCAMGGVSYKAISSAISRVQSDNNQIKLSRVLMEKLKENARTISENRFCTDQLRLIEN